MKNYSKSVRIGGEAGKGQHTKMANQITVAGNLAGTIEFWKFSPSYFCPLTT